MYIYIYTYPNLPRVVIVRLPHPRSGDSHGRETFSASSADKQTGNYDTECSNHHPSQSSYIYIYIYIYIYVYITEEQNKLANKANKQIYTK